MKLWKILVFAMLLVTIICTSVIAKPLGGKDRQNLTALVSYHIQCMETLRTHPLNFIKNPLPARDAAALLASYFHARYKQSFVQLVKESGTEYYAMGMEQFSKYAGELYGYIGSEFNEGTLTTDGDLILVPKATPGYYGDFVEDIPQYTCIRAEENDYGIITATFVLEQDHDVANFEVFAGAFMRNENQSFRILYIEPVTILLED